MSCKYTNFGPFVTNKAPQDGEIADRNSLRYITQQVQVAGAR
jgi:hypothetical protein